MKILRTEVSYQRFGDTAKLVRHSRDFQILQIARAALCALAQRATTGRDMLSTLIVQQEMVPIPIYAAVCGPVAIHMQRGRG